MDAITGHSDCQISQYLAFRLSNQPLPGIQTVKSAVRAAQQRGRIFHLKSIYFVHLLHRFYASDELEGVMAHIVSTNI